MDVLLVDAGIMGEPLAKPDVSREDVAAAAGADVGALAAAGDRGAAIETMARGAAEIVQRLHAEGRLDGIAGLGGSGGSALVTQAMRALPVGVPKLMVSTVASGDTRPYVGATDVTMTYRSSNLRRQPDLGADHGQRGRRDRRHGEGDHAAADGDRPLIGRRCSASRRPV